MRGRFGAHLLQKVCMECLALLALQLLCSFAPRAALDVQRLQDALVDRDEAALVHVVGDWDEASHLEFVVGVLVPSRRIIIILAPARHVQVAADEIHRGGVCESHGFVDCGAELPCACAWFFRNVVVQVEAQDAQLVAAHAFFLGSAL